ncbi:MAG: phosphoribosyltransferase [Candidatus Nanoarchaeia archaeon]|nr:phosphoribosyltransferase [Candidatus Nanoarchaeia archaeon]
MKSEELWNKVGYFSIAYLKDFASKIKELFIEKNYKIDLIVGGGNTGASMTRLTQIILKDLKINIPSLALPIYRYTPTKKNNKPYEGGYKDKFDNSILLDDVKKKLRGISFNNVIFVDDEIGEGNTAKMTLDLLIKASEKPIKNYFLVAEDQDFLKINNWVNKYSKINIKIFPYRKGIKNLFNIITYNVPYNYNVKIKNIIPVNELSETAYMNVLLGEPVKEFINGMPKFTYKYEEILNKKIKGFKKMQKDYLEYLKIILNM